VRRNAREAIELCIEVYQKKGWLVPPSDADPQDTVGNQVQRGHRFQRKADSNPVIADSR
jgi:hypothetical protein